MNVSVCITNSRGFSTSVLSFLLVVEHLSEVFKRVDWKVLGLLLGLSVHTLESIEADCEKSAAKAWIETGQAYWYILVMTLRKPAFEENDLASKLAKKYLSKYVHS